MIPIQNGQFDWARAFADLRDNPQAGELDHGQWLALLLGREEAERDDRRLTYRLRNARLRHAEACRSYARKLTGR
ncbi:MAG: hypothetical protein H8E36_15775 [Rhodospirillaceae bacterium]|nr:hypothetical protein [Rhodospirillaceae bacterium]